MTTENRDHAATHARHVPATHGANPRTRRWLVSALMGALACSGIGLGAAAMAGRLKIPFSRSDEPDAAAPAPSEPPTVKVVRPRRQAAVPVTVEQLAMVEPYYRADLRARASGIVRRVHHDIGNRVRAGDVLVEIDSPELEQDVARAEALVEQRRQELKVSEARLKDARAARDVAAATIRQKEADVETVSATRDFKKRKLERFKELAGRGTVVGNVVEEEERDYLSSESAVAAARAAVDRARADFAESESKIEAAAADIDLKKAQIEVSRRELDRALAMANYARVTAPFDGVVVRRTVDPGSFVQNATTGTTEELISIARIDLVTVSAKFPDTVAPLVARGAPATLSFADLPGLEVDARVTRYSPSVQNADRSMRVEVDLFNGDDADYARLESASRNPGATRAVKSMDDPMPVRVTSSGPGGPARRLIPGMTGAMRLSVGGFGDSYVLPSTAVYTRGGATYVLLVEDGRTREIPVRVQVNDGKTVRVVLLETRRESDGSARRSQVELRGDEQVVAARQIQIGGGREVRGHLTEW